MKNLILHQFGETSHQLMEHLTDSIRQGRGVFGTVFHNEAFQYLNEHPDKLKIYQKAMDESSELLTLALLSSYDFRGIRNLVDIGGGHGALLANILDIYPGIRGILFDQPYVVGGAKKLFNERHLNERISVVPGNFFEDIPEGADAYLLKNVLHAFDDEQCILLLEKIRQAMDPKGKVIILETLLKDSNKAEFGKLFDLLLMTGSTGGRERTKVEFENILDRSGFCLTRFMRTVAPFYVIEVVEK